MSKKKRRKKKILSLEAVAILNNMVYVPERNNRTMKQMFEFFKNDTEKTIRKAIGELIDYGYVSVHENGILSVNKDKVSDLSKI